MEIKKPLNGDAVEGRFCWEICLAAAALFSAATSAFAVVGAFDAAGVVGTCFGFRGGFWGSVDVRFFDAFWLGDAAWFFSTPGLDDLAWFFDAPGFLDVLRFGCHVLVLDVGVRFDSLWR